MFEGVCYNPALSSASPRRARSQADEDATVVIVSVLVPGLRLEPVALSTGLYENNDSQLFLQAPQPHPRVIALALLVEFVS
jgi:hypothetical protein